MLGFGSASTTDISLQKRLSHFSCRYFSTERANQGSSSAAAKHRNKAATIRPTASSRNEYNHIPKRDVAPEPPAEDPKTTRSSCWPWRVASSMILGRTKSAARMIAPKMEVRDNTCCSFDGTDEAP